MSDPVDRAPGPAEHTPHPMDRRRFLRGAAVVGGGVVAGGLIGETLRHRRSSPLAEPSGGFDSKSFAPPGQAHVAVLRQTSYDTGLEAQVLAGLKAIGADVTGANVLLKPNFVEYDPNNAINTDPRLVAAAALAFRALGAASVTVGEGPGHRRDTQYVMTRSGLLDAVHAVDVPFVDLNTDAVTPRTLTSHYTKLRDLWLPQAVANADIVVSMPKMKTHHWAGVTLSLKNCFGCVPGRVYGWPKNALHWAGLENAILDVAGAVRPRYAIVDGIVGMEGNGPISGTPVHAGLLVFGDDPVATDVTSTRLMGMDPAKIPYLVTAGAFLGQSDPAKIITSGEDVESSVVPFKVLPVFQSLQT